MIPQRVFYFFCLITFWCFVAECLLWESPADNWYVAVTLLSFVLTLFTTYLNHMRKGEPK